MNIDYYSLAKLYVEWSTESQKWLEGFQRPITGQNIEYHSSLPHTTQALICRATDGTMTVEWETQIVPIGYDDDYITFIWPAGLGVNLGNKKFDLFVNDEKWFTFRTGTTPIWQIFAKNKSVLRFEAVRTDAANDLFGYMWLRIPKVLVKHDKSCKIRVVGEKANSSAWFMVYKQENVVEQFTKASHRGFWYRISWTEGDMLIRGEFPKVWAEKIFRIIDKNGVQYSKKLIAAEQTSYAEITMGKRHPEKLSAPIKVQIDNKTIDLIDSLYSSVEKHTFYRDGLLALQKKMVNHKNHIFESCGSYVIDIPEELNKVANSYFKDGIVHLITSSHQDIAWMDEPKSCIEQRDTNIITPALELLERNPTYHYSIEQVLMLKEYLERHPGRVDDIIRFTKEGRLEWGATYNQPYEGMYSGESLVRQLFFGQKVVKKGTSGLRYTRSLEH